MATVKRRRVLQRCTSVEQEPDCQACDLSAAPPGLRSQDDVVEWPLDVVSSLCGAGNEECQLRLRNHVLKGMVLTTDYSGLDCPREALEMGVRALQHVMNIEPGAQVVHVGRTCDKGLLQKRVQVELAQSIEAVLQDHERCHFEDILHRLPQRGQDWIAAASPGKHATKAERAEAHAAIADWLMQNRSWLFSKDATAFCCVHQRRCRVHQCLLGEQEERLRMNVAGVTCHAWSSEGLLEGTAHESEIPLAVWLAERKFMFEECLEDVLFLECTPRFPAQDRLERVFGDSANVFAWQDGPEWHGWPHRRRRVLAVAVNKRTAAWVGETGLSTLQEQYARRFYRQMSSTGEMLMMASDEERIKEMTAIAVGRKNNVNAKDIAELVEKKDMDGLACLLFPPGGVKRLGEWQGLYMDKKIETPRLRAFLCDVDHAVGGKGPCGGELWPTQLTHGSIISFQRSFHDGDSKPAWRLATAKEHLSALGWRMYGGSNLFPVSHMSTVLTNLQLTPSQVKVLAGNSMHLRTQMAFMLYAMGQIIKKSPGAQRLTRMSTWMDEVDAMDDEDMLGGFFKQDLSSDDDDEICFAATCEKKVKPHSKFCGDHHKDAEAIRYQARQKKNADISAAVEAALGDPAKAQLALDDFARNNPSGKFRKSLIDWSAFTQSFGKRAEFRVRNNEEQMDVTDFVKWQKGRGLTDEEALQKWKDLLETDVEREGEGHDTKVWVVRNKQRFRDQIRFNESALKESSKQVKGIAESDRQDLLDHVNRQCDSFADPWLRRGVPQQSDEPAASSRAPSTTSEVPSRPGGKVEIAIAAPRAFEKNEKIVPSCVSMVDGACTAVREVLELASNNVSEEKLQQAYETNCVVRLRVLQIWQADSLQDIPAQRALPSSSLTGGSTNAEAVPPASLTSPPSTKEASTAAAEPSAEEQKKEKAETPVVGGDKADGSEEKDTDKEVLPESPKAQEKADVDNAVGVDAKSVASSTPVNVVAKITNALRKALDAGKSSAQHVKDSSHVLCRAHMEDIHQSFLHCETVDELNKQVETLKNAAAVVKELKDGASKAASSLKSHILNRHKAQKRKRVQEEKQMEQVEISAKKKQAKEAAEQVKQQETTLPPIFGISLETLKNDDGSLVGKPVTILSGPGKGSINSVDAPCCITSLTAMTNFMKNPKVQVMLGGFGGTYKKAAALKASGKCQELIQKGNGMEECDGLFKEVGELFKEACFTQAGAGNMERYLSNILQASWLFGYEAQSAHLNQLPNGLGCFRLLCSGEVAWTLYDLKKLVPAMRIMLSKDDIGGLEGVSAFLKALTDRDMITLSSHGCAPQWIVQKEGQIMFIPAGFVATEHCKRGVLVYGIRKTLLYASNEAAESYSVLISLHEASKKPVDKLKATACFLSAVETE
ncbi:unnamed protein product [Symbiodinium sp. CCMP2456]|nr:unnamed protein product [Symbiodinium sp. CCMP2456]